MLKASSRPAKAFSTLMDGISPSSVLFEVGSGQASFAIDVSDREALVDLKQLEGLNNENRVLGSFKV